MDIHKLIAAINPDVFCQPKHRSAVKGIFREALVARDRLAYLKAAAKAESMEPNRIPVERLLEVNIFKLPGQLSSIEQHALVVEHADEALEPLYFGLLDDLQQRENARVTKLRDTLAAGIGAGLNGDLARRITQRQEQAARLMTRMHTRVRGLMRLWQKWHEEKERLSAYADIRALEPAERERAIRLLWNRWDPRSDLGSVAGSEPNGTGSSAGLERAAAKLRTDLALDRDLLASELRLLKLEADWLRPCLHDAHESEPDSKDPALVKAFNTALFEVVLLVELPSDIELAVGRGDLPKMLLGRQHRCPVPVVIVEMRFRAVPERGAPGSYVYRGRVDLVLTSYALNAEELAVLRREVERSEYGEILGTMGKETLDTFHELLADLDELLADGDETPIPSKPDSEDTNPFAALLSLFEWFKPSSPKESPFVLREPLRPDSDIEQVLRSWSLLEAREACLDVYEHEKERLDMPSWREAFLYPTKMS